MNKHRFLGALLLAAACAPLHANVGYVLYSRGDANAIRDGVERPLLRGSTVETGDLLTTGPGAYLQIRMTDGAMIAVRPATQFLIEAYELPEKPVASDMPAAATVATAPQRSTGRAIMSLLRGGFRTVTGLIGRVNHSDYKVNTPQATIGIRGTNYTALVCNQDCGDMEDGLHASVSEHGVVLTNNAGTLGLDDDGYAYVATINTRPQQRLERPSGLNFNLPEGDEGDEDGSDASDGPAAETGGGETGESTETADSGSDTGDGDPGTIGPVNGPATEPSPTAPVTGSPAVTAQAPPQQQDQPPPDQPIAGYVPLAFATAPYGESGLEERAVLATRRVTRASNGDLTAFERDLQDESGQVVAQRFQIGTASTFDRGFDPASQIRWGRWSEGTATVDGNALDLGQQSLHWIYGPETSSTPAIRRSGTVNFSLVGNTNPTDDAGNVGFLGSASLTADFSNFTVHSELQLSVNEEVWMASGDGTLGPNGVRFNGHYGSVVVDGNGGGSGRFSGFIVPGSSSGALPRGAGLSYWLSHSGRHVSGAAAFGNAQAGN